MNPKIAEEAHERLGNILMMTIGRKNEKPGCAAALAVEQLIAELRELRIENEAMRGWR